MMAKAHAAMVTDEQILAGFSNLFQVITTGFDEVRAEFAAVRAEMAAMRSELRAEIRGEISGEVTGEALDLCVGDLLVDHPHGVREDRGAAVGEIVTIDGGEHEVLPAHLGDRFGDTLGFEPVHLTLR